MDFAPTHASNQRVPRPPQPRLQHPVSDPKKKQWVAAIPEIYVVGCNRRPGLVLPYLADQSHHLHIGTDYDLPADAVPMRADYDSGSPWLGNYRVFRSHQDICKKFLKTGSKFCLIFEDDAVPNTADWVQVVNDACESMRPGVDILSLYGRNFKPHRFETVYTLGKRKVLQLRADVPQSEADRGGRHHVHGSLAYILTRKGAKKVSELPWRGIPCDCDFWDLVSNFQFIHPSPFNHDRTTGSILFPSSCPPKVKDREIPKPDAPRDDQEVS